MRQPSSVIRVHVLLCAAGRILDAVVARDEARFHAALKVFLLLSVATGLARARADGAGTPRSEQPVCGVL